MPRISKKTLLRDLIARRGWQEIGEPEWHTIRLELPTVAPEDLQGLDVPVEAPWCGVRQHTFDDLEASLCALGEVYCGREELRRFCRLTVIRAKERARWAARSARVQAEKRAVKAEMVEWMLVWLGDPSLFAAWVALRRNRLIRPE